MYLIHTLQEAGFDQSVFLLPEALVPASAPCSGAEALPNFRNCPTHIVRAWSPLASRTQARGEKIFLGTGMMLVTTAVI